MKKIINKNEKGITLIALVITIIVLIILVGVAISMLTGENGIIKKVIEAKDNTKTAQEDEEKDLENLESLIKENLDKGVSVTNPYESDGWDFAYSAKNGVWSNKITNKLDLDETADVVAKFYKTGNKITIPDINIYKFAEGDEYALVIEGKGEMPALGDGNNVYAWMQVVAEFVNNLDSGTISGATPIEVADEIRVSNLIICDGITNISGGAFMFMFGLSNVTMANTVKKVDQEAFAADINLKNIDISNVTYIGDNAFAETAISSIKLLNDVIIGQEAFCNCKSLSIVEISNVKTIGEKAFYQCVGLKEIYINNAINIENRAFLYCEELTTVHTGPTLSIIGEAAFMGCEKLTNLEMSNVTTIANEAFKWCDKLEEIKLKRIINIGSNAFCLCESLTTVCLGTSLSSISDEAFFSCTAMETVYYAGSEEQWNNIIGIDSWGNDSLKEAEKVYNYEF